MLPHEQNPTPEQGVQLRNWSSARRAIKSSRTLNAAMSCPILGESRKIPYRVLAMAIAGDPEAGKGTLGGWRHIVAKGGEQSFFGVWRADYRDYVAVRMVQERRALTLLAPFPTADTAVLQEIERRANGEFHFVHSGIVTLKFSVARNGELAFPRDVDESLLISLITHFRGPSQEIAFGKM